MSDNIINSTNKEIDLIDLLSIIVRNMKWIIIITVFFMIATLIFSILSILLPSDKSLMPNVYSPKSLVMLNNNKSGGIDSILKDSGIGAFASIAGMSSGEGYSDSDLAIKLATTNSFLYKLDKEFDLKNIYNEDINPKYPKTSLRKIINEKLKIKMDESSGILVITYTDIDRTIATKIVNKATDILEEEFLKIDVIRNTNQFALVEDKKHKVENEIEHIKKETIKFQKEHNLVDVDIVFDELMKLVTVMQTNLINKEIEIESYGSVSNVADPGYKRLLNEKKSILNAIEKLQNGEIGNYPPVKELPKLALELGQLKAEMEIKQTVYKTIIQQYESLKLTSGGTGPTFQVLEKADIPEIKSGPSRSKLCVLVTIMGFFLSLIFIFLKEVWLNIVNDSDKMKRLKGER